MNKGFILCILAIAAIHNCDGRDPGMVRIFNACSADSDCAQMNGRCFDSRGNDIGRYCSCDIGFTFDAPNAVCERQSIIASRNASRIVSVSRTKSGIYYLEQKGADSLTRGRARFPSQWMCDTGGSYCWATDQTAYITSIDIDAIRTNDGADTYIRYRDIIFRCTNDSFPFVRQNDDMSNDPDLGNAARPVAENCVAKTKICSSIGTGVINGTKCQCNLGWSGPTCQVSTVYNISRPVRPARLCAFPSNTTCAENEVCYLWEGSTLTDQGYCWCRPGYLPAAAATTTTGTVALTPSVCVRTPNVTYFGAIAEPYIRDAPAFSLLLDARSRQYAHYTGQGYEYASIMPYPVQLNNTLFRINDTMADASGYLYRCDLAKAYWNETSRECMINVTRVSPAASTASVPIHGRFAYNGCTSGDAYGPNCTMNGTECRTSRCTNHGDCIGVYQGCSCDPGWGLYNCSARTCKPNVQNPADPHVFFSSTGRCNCSDAYLGIFCDWYTCGNKYATYRPPSQGGCICGGDWIINQETGNCTTTPCADNHTLSDADPSVCVLNETFRQIMDDEIVTPDIIHINVTSRPVYQITDDRAPVKSYTPSLVLISIQSLVGIESISLVFTVLHISGALIHW